MGWFMGGLMARGFSRSGGRMRGGGRRAGRQAPRRKEWGAQTDDVGGLLRGNKKQRAGLVRLSGVFRLSVLTL